MMISLRLNDDDAALFRKYAELNKMSVSDMIRQAVMEKIEDEYDMQTYKTAMAEYRKTSVTYSHEEVGKMLGLN